jgi:hypothetical protein
MNDARIEVRANRSAAQLEVEGAARAVAAPRGRGCGRNWAPATLLEGIRGLRPGTLDASVARQSVMPTEYRSDSSTAADRVMIARGLHSNGGVSGLVWPNPRGGCSTDPGRGSRSVRRSVTPPATTLRHAVTDHLSGID